MPVDDQEKPTKGTDRGAHIAIDGNRLFQTADEAKIKKLEKVADALAESGQAGVGTPGGVEIMGPDQVDDRDTHDLDDEAPTAE